MILYSPHFSAHEMNSTKPRFLIEVLLFGAMRMGSPPLSTPTTYPSPHFCEAEIPKQKNVLSFLNLGGGAREKYKIVRTFFCFGVRRQAHAEILCLIMIRAPRFPRKRGASYSHHCCCLLK
jgi:hypothetical protein